MGLDLFTTDGTGLLDRETALEKGVQKDKDALSEKPVQAKAPKKAKARRKAPTKAKVTVKKAKTKTRELPKDFTGPTMMDCGHWSFWREKAGCGACKTKSPGNVRFLSEKHGVPVPMNQRRTQEKEDFAHGFPGLCCDEDGQYIGGIGNDCRFGQRPDSGKRCIVHKR